MQHLPEARLLLPERAMYLAENPAHTATVAELSAKLREAVKTTFPADGKTPVRARLEVLDVTGEPIRVDGGYAIR